MNSPNQPSRQYHHNTCELSIEDKKSPFPAWMKFNKPNPLKFNLSLQDPDRPEQPPITISGDRVKLDILHQTVGEYVGNLLAKSPLPLSTTPDSELAPAASAEAHLERPIDALKMTGDRPHLEADGPSRHLLYLGNMADDGQVMASLSTLQLFDFSSTLDEAAQPLAAASTEDSSAALGSIGTEIKPETTATGAAAAIVPPPPPTGPMVVQKLETDVEEPRVVLPSVKEAVHSDSLESESSFFERNSTVDNNDRFKMPKPSLGSLNLPELPDFSNSPLTSIWLWLGLGTVATGIVAFPFLNKSVSELTSKPTATTQSTPGASAESSDLASIPSYQPSPAATPSGVNSSPPSNSSSPSASPNPSVTISPNGGQVTLTPAQSGYGITPGINNNSAIGGLGNGNIGNSRIGTGNSARNQANGQAPTDNRLSTASRFGSSSTGNQNNNGTTPLPSDVLGKSRGTRKSNPSPLRSSSPTPNNISPADDPNGSREFKAKTTPEDPIAAINRNAVINSERSRSRSVSSAESNGTRARVAAPTASPQTDLIGQGQSLIGEGDPSINTPIPNIPTDPASTLSSPNGSRLGDSAQVDSTRQYLQTRWRADPNFNDSLQYNLRVGRDGKVVSVDGQTAASRKYLKVTNFIAPGTQVTNSGSQDQNMTVILKPDGSVEALGN